MVYDVQASNQGKVAEVSGVSADVTESRQAEELQRQSEQRYQRLVDTSPEAVVVYSAGRIVYINEAALILFGAICPEELLGQCVFDRVHPDYREPARERARLSQEEGIGSPLKEQKYLRLDGSVIDVESVSTPIIWENQPGGQVWIRDITKRRQSEKALQEAQENLEEQVALRTAELESVNDALKEEILERCNTEEELNRVLAESEQILSSITSLMIGVNGNQKITIWNTAARQLLGISLDEAIGRKIEECAIPWDWEIVHKAIHQCMASKAPARAEDVRYQRDGKECFLGLTVNPVCNHHEDTSGYLLLAADITQRKILESQLAQSQKLESIGQLAAGIAHELNTPIQYVGDNTRFLSDAFCDMQSLLVPYQELAEAVRSGENIQEALSVVDAAVSDADIEYLRTETPLAITQSLDGIERVTTIVKAMKEFSHPGTGAKSPFDINKAITSTITVARNEWKYVAEVTMDLDPDLPPVPCLPGEINQVFLNILVNAAHAIADAKSQSPNGKGAIHIITRRSPAGAPDGVDISISDTGTGIPPQIRAKIFDPFFTTKQVGKGTGQGLSISHTIVVEKHGGAIFCESEVGSGTVFTIRLPLTENQRELDEK
jgi:PAS domain S-box-containing protein